MATGLNSFKTKTNLLINNKSYTYFSLKQAEEQYFPELKHLPISLKILFENLLRFEDNKTVTKQNIIDLANWHKKSSIKHEIAYRPARVLMQDFTGVPAIVDLAAMRNALQKMDNDPNKISPLLRVDLVIDHSIMVDYFATNNALQLNTDIEMQRNQERYEFLRWGQQAFNNFHVVPPGSGICHQVNLEHLAQVVWSHDHDGTLYAYPDTLVGTDSHTTMINSLGVLGWGVGGIEAEAAMLGQPVSMLVPEVIGFKLIGKLHEGITATDLVLTITQMLRKHGVVGKFVEFYGPGLNCLTVPDRATIANMAPEYGATCGFFPIDAKTLEYLQLTGRSSENIELVEAYAKIQGLWFDNNYQEANFTDTIIFNLDTVKPSLAGPSRPQDRVELTTLPQIFERFLQQQNKIIVKNSSQHNNQTNLQHGDIVIAAITSCTNTSNPNVLIAAGLLAKKAIAKGLMRKPWVKSSLAPGSKVVSDYLQKTGLQTYLNQLGFNLVGYGCTTCIGNSGPLDPEITKDIINNDLVVCAILSGNRNFEGRIHPQVRANWLASPPLVVAYSLLGNINYDLTKDSLGVDQNNNPVYLKDIWPSNEEIAVEVAKINRSMFHKEYVEIFNGDAHWQAIKTNNDKTYQWNHDSTYIQHPPFFTNLPINPHSITPIHNAYILAILGDSITTDHISPAGSIKPNSPAGIYLKSKGVLEKNFNSYGSRRGNHEVMMRGTFANIRIHNEMTPGIEGGMTCHIPTKQILSIYDAAMLYQQYTQPLVIIAGKEYGTGSSRDWAAKGVNLLGIKAVITESFERIHRSNLLGMGVLPLQFKPGETRKTLELTGKERISIEINDTLTPNAEIKLTISRNNANEQTIYVICRIDTENEIEYYRNGGILQYVLRNLAKTK